MEKSYCLKCRKVSTGKRCPYCGAQLVKLSDRASMIAVRPSQRISIAPELPEEEEPGLNLQFDAACHVGLKRNNNEDMILLNDHLVRNAEVNQSVTWTDDSRFCAVVADGMGGNDGGEFASELALKSFRDFINSLPAGIDTDEIKTRIAHWTIATHKHIDKGGGNARLAKMGTTLSGCFFFDGKMYWINIGDSRIYILRDGVFRQITNDHTLRNLMHDMTIPSNIIYNCLGGGGKEVFADFDEMPIYDNDRLLICSDGLSDMLSEVQLVHLLEDGEPASRFVEQANEAGGRDNISVITIKIKDRR